MKTPSGSDIFLWAEVQTLDTPPYPGIRHLDTQ